MRPNVKILISCHKETERIESDIFQPIQVGTALAGHPYLEGMLHDNDGDNISAWNPMYCELTAQYYAWKNLDLDYYGFCHYRRYFNLSEERYKEDSYGNIVEDYLDQEAIEQYALHDDAVYRCIEGQDIVITERKDMRRLSLGGFTPALNYKHALGLHYEDFQTMISIIDEQMPEYSASAHQFADGHTACFCNMYIMRKEYFHRYCDWMFPLLEEFCRRTDMTHYSKEALRTPGHLSERLFNIWLMYEMEHNPALKVKELQCVLFSQTEVRSGILHPAFEHHSVPVFFAANDAYSPMFAACLQSLLTHTSKENNYDIVLISTDISQQNKRALASMTAPYPNVSLRFYHPGILLSRYQLKANEHISVETYYRFLIQSIVPEYSKVLYLDCDMIIQDDVAILYNTDLTGYMLGAVHDADFLGQINTVGSDQFRYASQDLGMQDPYNYFQAGALLLNEDEMRRAHTTDEWLTFASTNYRYNDQDVLNKYCEGRVLFLDMAWNLLTDCDHFRVDKVISQAPADIWDEYQAARRHPRIIHYAGFKKPWYCPTEDMAHEFWRYLRETEYYEDVLYTLTCRICGEQPSQTVVQYIDKPSGLRLRIRRWIDRWLPRGTRRRERLDRLYTMLFFR